jgi:hypothetical protein
MMINTTLNNKIEKKKFFNDQSQKIIEKED